MGGVGLNDASAGLQDRLWLCTCDGATGDVSLEAPGVGRTLIFTAPGTTEVSFCFDQNMRPVFAYVQNGAAKLRWYDTVLGDNTITTLASDVVWPKVTLDDKRPLQTVQGTSDVILAYVRGGSLYYRQQRDRFEVERLLAGTVSGRLVRVGMTVTSRLQFMFEEA